MNEEQKKLVLDNLERAAALASSYFLERERLGVEMRRLTSDDPMMLLRDPDLRAAVMRLNEILKRS